MTAAFIRKKSQYLKIIRNCAKLHPSQLREESSVTKTLPEAKLITNIPMGSGSKMLLLPTKLDHTQGCHFFARALPYSI